MTDLQKAEAYLKTTQYYRDKMGIAIVLKIPSAQIGLRTAERLRVGTRPGKVLPSTGFSSADYHSNN